MKIESINEFLRQAGFSFVVYDMGRRMVRLTPQQFNQFENGVIAYPTPLQQHAWLGLLGWQEDDKSRHFIWFLKLPLDELGKINPPARDELLHYLVNQLGQRLLTTVDSADSATALPHGFIPGQETMSMFHAKAARLLEQPPSRYYSHARDYLAGTQGYEQWAFVHDWRKTITRVIYYKQYHICQASLLDNCADFWNMKILHPNLLQTSFIELDRMKPLNIFATISLPCYALLVAVAILNYVRT